MQNCGKGYWLKLTVVLIFLGVDDIDATDGVSSCTVVSESVVFNDNDVSDNDVSDNDVSTDNDASRSTEYTVSAVASVETTMDKTIASR